MEPIVLRRPLMARGRRTGKGDCRIITITLLFAALLGAVIFVSYPGPGPSGSGAGLLANIQDQAASLLGSRPGNATELLTDVTTQAQKRPPQGQIHEQPRVKDADLDTEIAIKDFDLGLEPRDEGTAESDTGALRRDAAGARGASEGVAFDVRAHSADPDEGPALGWVPEEQRDDPDYEGTKQDPVGAKSGAQRGKPKRPVRGEKLDLEGLPTAEQASGLSTGPLSGSGGAKTSVEKRREKRWGQEEQELPAAVRVEVERGVEGQNAKSGTGSEPFLLPRQGEVERRKEGASHGLPRQWGADTLDKMVLAGGESEVGAETQEEGIVEGDETLETDVWEAAELDGGPAEAPMNATGLFESLANALGLSGKPLNRTADLDQLAKETATAIASFSNRTVGIEGMGKSSLFNASLVNVTAFFETMLGNKSQANSSGLIEKLAGLVGLTRREVEAVWPRNMSAALGGAGSSSANTSCTGSACPAVPALKALFTDALNTGTLYIGPDPCPLFQLLNGSALTGIVPLWNASVHSHPPEQSCTDSVTQVSWKELRKTVAGQGGTLKFDLVVVADTLEKLDVEDARSLIAAVAGVAAGPVIVAVSAVEQARTKWGSKTRAKQGPRTYEKDTWWVEAFAAEGLVEVRAKSPLLEEARAELPGGALLHLVPARGNITEESAGEVLWALPVGQGLSSNYTAREHSSSSNGVNGDLRTVIPLDENAPGTQTETERSGASDRKEADMRKEKRTKGDSLRAVGAFGEKTSKEQKAAVSDPGEQSPAAKKAGGKSKPALGLAARVGEAVHEEEGEKLQEALERDALVAELEPKKDRLDTIAEAGSETEGGATSAEAAEDRKALNKRLPEAARLAHRAGAAVKEVRRESEDERRRSRLF